MNCCRIKVRICDPQPLRIKVKSNVIINETTDEYDGQYEINPSFDDQILETKNKLMTDDVTVNAITVSRTTNPSGGKTVYIGGTITYGE